MADNVQLNSMTGGSDVRTTQTASSKHIQHIRLDKGVATAEEVITDTAGLPIEGAQTTATATISSGASLSSEIDLEGFDKIAIFMPATWTAANLAFKGAYASGGTFNYIYDRAGNKVIAVAAADYVIVDLSLLGPVRFLKIVSETSGTPVNQAGDRSLVVIKKA